MVARPKRDHNLIMILCELNVLTLIELKFVSSGIFFCPRSRSRFIVNGDLMMIVECLCVSAFVSEETACRDIHFD